MKKLALTYKVAMEIAAHEAVIRQAYKDSVGVWTWSVGLTDHTGHDVERYIGKPQPIEHCLAVFVWALDNYADDVRSKFKDVELTEAQFAAALSFHWNTGAIRTASWVNSFLKGNREKARGEIMNWVTPPEITERRRKEQALFFDGKWSQGTKMLEYTEVRASGTPVWSSAKQIEVSDLLRDIIAKHNGEAVQAPIADPKPQPQPEPEGPKLENGVIVTPDWTAAEHIANIEASARALRELTGA